MRRIVVTAALAVVSLVVLAGCVPTPIPIHLDGDAGKTISKAEWRVAAVTTSKGPGIEIRMRNCATLRITGPTIDGEQRAHMRPVAYVTDSKGKVLFANASPISEVRPAGSQVIDTTTPTTDDLQRIIVPTSGATGAITVKPTCTTYPGYGSGPGFSWDFDGCTTTTRSCATRKAGRGTFRS